MRGNRRRDTSPELRLRRSLHARGLRFRVDYSISFPGGNVKADVAFPAARVAVFVDGCFWHCCPLHGTQPGSNRSYWTDKLGRNVERDARVTAGLRIAGWKVLRFWEHEIVNDLDEVVASVSGLRKHG